MGGVVTGTCLLSTAVSAHATYVEDHKVSYCKQIARQHLCHRTDGRTDGRTDEKVMSISHGILTCDKIYML